MFTIFIKTSKVSVVTRLGRQQTTDLCAVFTEHSVFQELSHESRAIPSNNLQL